jgi:hypothetical protein
VVARPRRGLEACETCGDPDTIGRTSGILPGALANRKPSGANGLKRANVLGSGGSPPRVHGSAAPTGSDTGLLRDPELVAGEREARMALFWGAIGVFKNPTSHPPGDYSDPTVAAEAALLADLLLRMLDDVTPRQPQG